MSIYRPVSALVAVGLLLGACSGSTPAQTSASSLSPSSVASASPVPSASVSSAPSTSPNASLSPSPTIAATPTPTAPPTPPPTPSPSPTPAAFTLNATVWYSGYLITVTGGTFDPVKHKLNIDATFQNTSTQQTEVSQLSNSVKIVWNSQFLAGYVTSGLVPVGATASAQIQLQPPAGFDVAGAVLTFGQPDEHQATVPLNGDAAASDQPTVLAIAGKVKMGKKVIFSITKSMLVPASCTGYPERVKYGPLKKNLVSIVLWGLATNSDALNYAYIDQGYIAVPDGTSAVSVPPVGLSIPGKGTLRDQAMCFAVPAPGSGSYKLTMHEQRSKASASLTFIVP